MKIYIKQDNKKTIFIPAPLGLVKMALCLGFGKIGISIAKRHVPEEQIEFLNNIDIQRLRKSIDILREYKGLKIVDATSSDGTFVKIII